MVIGLQNRHRFVVYVCDMPSFFFARDRIVEIVEDERPSS